MNWPFIPRIAVLPLPALALVGVAYALLLCQTAIAQTTSDCERCFGPPVGGDDVNVASGLSAGISGAVELAGRYERGSIRRRTDRLLHHHRLPIHGRWRLLVCLGGP